MSKLKLTYFDFHGGRGEPARLALSIGEIPFDPEILSVEFCASWSVPATMTGSAPMLRGNAPVVPGAPTLVISRIPLFPPETILHCPVGNGMA